MPDMIWQNQRTGDVYYWLMNKTRVSRSGYLARGMAPEWKIVSTADLDGDGKPDLIWQNQKTGDVYFWTMNGTAIRDRGYIVRSVSLDWRIVGAADLTGDGKPDLIWQNSKTGDVLYWVMNGTQWSGMRSYIQRAVATEWKIVSVGDYVGAGKPNLLWQNTKTGDVVYWTMNGGRWTGDWAYICRNVGTQWSVVGPH
jgi:hypothetical protein